MKVFNARFFGGVCIVAVGSLAVLTGIMPLLSPEKTNYTAITGIVLILAGAICIKIGFNIAKDTPKPGSKVTIDTLRRAKLLDKKRKK